MKRQSKSGDDSPDPINVRDFILSVAPPPAVYAEALLKEVEDVLTPDQIREFILTHQFPPIWGRDMEGEVRRRLKMAGFKRIACRCVDEHPVIQLRLSIPPGCPLSLRQLNRLLRTIAGDLGQVIPRSGLVASIKGNRAEAAMVLENPGAGEP